MKILFRLGVDILEECVRFGFVLRKNEKKTEENIPLTKRYFRKRNPPKEHTMNETIKIGVMAICFGYTAFAFSLLETHFSNEIENKKILDHSQVLASQQSTEIKERITPPKKELFKEIKGSEIPSYVKDKQKYAESSWEYSALRSIPKIRDKYGDLIERICDRENLSVRLLTTIIVVESLGDPNAVSPTGAKGLTQLTQIAVADVGMSGNLFDPSTNVAIGAAYLAKLRDQYGYSKKQAMAVAYNIGPGKAHTLSQDEMKNHDYAEKVTFVMKHL